MVDRKWIFRLAPTLVVGALLVHPYAVQGETTTPGKATHVSGNRIALQHVGGAGWAEGTPPVVADRVELVADGVTVGYVFTIVPGGWVYSCLKVFLDAETRSLSTVQNRHLSRGGSL